MCRSNPAVEPTEVTLLRLVNCRPEGSGPVWQLVEKSGRGYQLHPASKRKPTNDNYRTLWHKLKRHGTCLIAMQYPLTSVDSLEKTFELESIKPVFVSNEQSFQAAVASRGEKDVFIDKFAGNFGHTTVFGNTLIAKDVAPAVEALVKGGSCLGY